MSGKKAYVMGAYNEGKPSHVKPYRHPHFQGSFQGRQENRDRNYQGRRWNTHQYSRKKNLKTIIK
jgi:hypothetical protein